ncbi:MAG: ISAs1 family transposase [Verrucomicrobia bacterium]|nr:ISAs1 family transposase [Verrucomicrobiota bacterium]
MDTSLSPTPSALAPGAEPISLLLTGLRAIADTRAQGQVLHSLGDVLLTALFATIADCDDFVSMGIFAKTQLAWIRQYVPLVNGAPSHDTFRNVFMMIKPAALLAITSAWVGSLEGLHVRIDGKVNRGVKDPETGRGRLHLLRAWVGEVGLSVGQAVCAEKSNEWATLPELLRSLELKGALVSIDAMAGHPQAAQQIHEAGGDWMLALKANEKGALEKISAHFRELCGQHATVPEGKLPEGIPVPKTLHPSELVPQQWPPAVSCHKTQEMNRGRYEEREVIVVPVGDWWPKAFWWYGIKSVICVIRRTMRQRHDREFPTQEVHYFLSSLEPTDAAGIAAAIRKHWHIENGCHHLLDVTFGEDHSQVRDRACAQSLTLLREISAKLLKDHESKGSIRSKRKEAAFSPNFRSKIIASIFHNAHA